MFLHPIDGLVILEFLLTITNLVDGVSIFQGLLEHNHFVNEPHLHQGFQCPMMDPCTHQIMPSSIHFILCQTF
jgi:hypothetical protein